MVVDKSKKGWGSKAGERGGFNFPGGGVGASNKRKK